VRRDGQGSWTARRAGMGQRSTRFLFLCFASSNAYRENYGIQILTESDATKTYTDLPREEISEKQNILDRDPKSTPMTDVIELNKHFGENPSDLYPEYEFIAPDGYILSLILDPCRGKEAGCCNDSFGNGEYFPDTESDETTPQSERVCEGTSLDCMLGAGGNPIDESASRVATIEIKYEPLCETADSLPIAFQWRS